MNYAIIPARGGSKGIPKKNLKLINGKSLLQRGIEAAQHAQTVDQVFVSTDCPEIRAEALRCGAKVIDRPAELSSDTASSEMALLHAIELWTAEGHCPDVLTFIQCTSPLTIAEDIDNCARPVVSGEAVTCHAVTPFHYFLWKPDDTGNWGGLGHDKRARMRRQDINFIPTLLDHLDFGAISSAADFGAALDALATAPLQQRRNITGITHNFKDYVQKVGASTGAEIEAFLQDHKSHYLETGAVYVMQVQHFVETGHRFADRHACSIIPEERVFEIDEPADLDIAEGRARVLEGKADAA